jgi:hypothetical protein
MMTPKTFGRPQADFDLGVPLAVALQHRFWTLSFFFLFRYIFLKTRYKHTNEKKDGTRLLTRGDYIIERIARAI